MCAASPEPDSAAGTPAEIDWRDGHLVSTRFDDVYFSRAGGLAETEAVFLAGCGLPEAWRGRRRFTVAELGFGTGLNMLALLALWARERPPGGTLHLFSVEAFPLPVEAAARAHAAIPGIDRALSALLLAHWPKDARGLHRIRFPALGAVLDLMVGDAAAAVANWEGKADAWFLDGFAPSRNPAMWGEALLADVAAHTAQGGRAATYSVAGHVRRALAAGGFAVERMPGFAGKRQRLEARMPGVASDPAEPRVAIVGAGIAGASLARAFRALGVEPLIFAAGPMASGNPAALVTPRLAAASPDAAALHAACFRAAVGLYGEVEGAVLAQGVDRMLMRRDDLPRAEASIASGLFERDSLRLDPPRLHLRDALAIEPARVREAWLGEVRPVAVHSISRARAQTLLHNESGAVLAAVDCAIIAAGIGSAGLAKLRLRPVRGQVSLSAAHLAGPPLSWGGYVAPTRDGLLFGATHDRDDEGWDVRVADNARNLESLAAVLPDLAARVWPLTGIAGVRAGTFHNQPIAGRIARGVFALAGLGGHGFALAPLLGEQIAAQVAGVALPLPRCAARLLG